jgi:hypothetical protein
MPPARKNGQKHPPTLKTNPWQLLGHHRHVAQSPENGILSSHGMRESPPHNPRKRHDGGTGAQIWACLGPPARGWGALRDTGQARGATRMAINVQFGLMITINKIAITMQFKLQNEHFSVLMTTSPLNSFLCLTIFLFNCNYIYIWDIIVIRD